MGVRAGNLLPLTFCALSFSTFKLVPYCTQQQNRVRMQQGLGMCNGEGRATPTPTPSPTLPSIMLKPVAPILRDRGGFFSEKPRSSTPAAPAPAPANSVPPGRGPVFSPSTALTAGGSSCLQQSRDCRGVLPVTSSKGPPVAAPPASRASPPQSPTAPGPTQSRTGIGRPAAPPPLVVPAAAGKAPSEPAPRGPPSPAPTAVPSGQGRRGPAPAPQPTSAAASRATSGRVPQSKMAPAPAPQQQRAVAPAPRPSGIPTTPAVVNPIVVQVRACGCPEIRQVGWENGIACLFKNALHFFVGARLVQDETEVGK